MTGEVPLIRIERGNPTDEETAAVVVALLALRARADAAPTTATVGSAAAWLRLERRAAFMPGHSWQQVARAVEPVCAGC